MHSPRYFEKGDDLLVVKTPEFAFFASEVDTIVGKMREHRGVVLDLRGNPRGYADTVDRLLCGLFQNDLKILDRVGQGCRVGGSGPVPEGARDNIPYNQFQTPLSLNDR